MTYKGYALSRDTRIDDDDNYIELFEGEFETIPEAVAAVIPVLEAAQADLGELNSPFYLGGVIVNPLNWSEGGVIDQMADGSFQFVGDEKFAAGPKIEILPGAGKTYHRGR